MARDIISQSQGVAMQVNVKSKKERNYFRHLIENHSSVDDNNESIGSVSVSTRWLIAN